MPRGRAPKVFVRPLTHLRRGTASPDGPAPLEQGVPAHLAPGQGGAHERAGPHPRRDRPAAGGHRGLGQGGDPRLQPGGDGLPPPSLATTRPQLIEGALRQLGASTPRAYLLKRRIVPGLQPRRGSSLQRTKSWKRSPDPEFDEKAERIQRLYEDPGPRHLLSGEHGPIQPVPGPGLAWAPRGLPKRAAPQLPQGPTGCGSSSGPTRWGQTSSSGRFFARKGFRAHG